MERMESSIHELIAALHQTARPQQQQTHLPPPQYEIPAPQTRAEINEINDDETDEDDNITRPTNAGTDESEERISPLPPFPISLLLPSSIQFPSSIRDGANP
jgi:hypothetical protein